MVYIFNQFDISEFINKFKNLNKEYIDSDDKDMTFIAENENMKIKILFSHISINKKSGDINNYSTKYIMIKYLK